MQEIPPGYCQCGCGGKTALSGKTHASRGMVKGQPNKFITWHHLGAGENHPVWKGGKTRTNGYVYIWQPGHPRANSAGYVLEHVLKAEKALGRHLPDGVHVHHADENRGNNANNNLVICQDAAYHKLLHVRLRALRACGNPNWRKCNFCKKWDDLTSLIAHMTHGSLSHFHNDCKTTSQRNRRRTQRENRERYANERTNLARGSAT